MASGNARNAELQSLSGIKGIRSTSYSIYPPFPLPFSLGYESLLQPKNNYGGEENSVLYGRIQKYTVHADSIKLNYFNRSGNIPTWQCMEKAPSLIHRLYLLW